MVSFADVVKISAENFYAKSIFNDLNHEFISFTCGYGKYVYEKENIVSCKEKLEINGIEPTDGVIHISSNGNVTFPVSLIIDGYVCKYALNTFVCTSSSI